MDAYTAWGDMFCTECVADVIRDGQFTRYQFDGPFPDGGGPADAPQHCANCGTFLRNPLTREGLQYVQALAVSPERCHSKHLTEWLRFYAPAEAGQP